MENAPVRKSTESPGRYLRRVTAFLVEPHRRRLGHATEMEVIKAIQELERS